MSVIPIDLRDIALESDLLPEDSTASIRIRARPSSRGGELLRLHDERHRYVRSRLPRPPARGRAVGGVSRSSSSATRWPRTSPTITRSSRPSSTRSSPITWSCSVQRSPRNSLRAGPIAHRSALASAHAMPGETGPRCLPSQRDPSALPLLPPSQARIAASGPGRRTPAPGTSQRLATISGKLERGQLRTSLLL